MFEWNKLRRFHLALLLLLLALVLATSLAWLPGSNAYAQEIPTATPELAPQLTATPQPLATRSPTPIPQEWAENINQTDGVIMGAVVLVLIVVFGTIHAIRRNNR